MSADGRWVQTQPTLRNLWSVKEYRHFWSVRAMSGMAYWVSIVSIGLMVVGNKGSALHAALLLIAPVLPALLAPFTGRLVDRYDIRKVIRSGEAIAATGRMCVALCAAVDAPLPVIALAIMFYGCGGATVGPAYESMATRLVPANFITVATSFNSIGINLNRMAGPLLAGALVSVTSPAVAFAVAACISATASWMGGRLDPGRTVVKKQEALPSYRSALAVRSVWMVIACFFGFSVLGPQINLILPLIGHGPTDTSILFALVSVGGMTSSLLITRFQPPTALRLGFVLIALGPATAGITLATDGIARVASIITLGVLFDLVFNTSLNVLLRSTAAAARGRVVGTWILTGSLGYTLGSLINGFACDALGTAKTMLGSGALTAVIGVVFTVACLKARSNAVAGVQSLSQRPTPCPAPRAPRQCRSSSPASGRSRHQGTSARCIRPCAPAALVRNATPQSGRPLHHG